MTRNTKYLVGLLCVHIFAIFFFVSLEANISRPDMDVINSLSGRFFHGDDEARFVMAVGNAARATDWAD